MQNIENVRVTVLDTRAVTHNVVGEDGKEITTESAKEGGIIALRVAEDSRPMVRDWFKGLVAVESWTSVSLAVDIRRWYKKKTFDQLKLFFSLVKIMSLETYGKVTEEYKSLIYHGLLLEYGATTLARLPSGEERETVKGLSEMNTVEANALIEGAFRELATIPGLSISSSRIRNYFIEWRTWRGQLKNDGLEETYKSLEEYKERVPYCEATGDNLGPGEGHLAHIVSKGAGGVSNEAWNYFHFSPQVHLYTQHTEGWVKLLREYPHLIGKVNRARERHGLGAIEKPDDLYDDFVKGKEEQRGTEENGELFPEEETQSTKTRRDLLDEIEDSEFGLY